LLSHLRCLFTCSTGNCTSADEYSSVALCSQCDDVSKDIVVTACRPRGVAAPGSQDPGCYKANITLTSRVHSGRNHELGNFTLTVLSCGQSSRHTLRVRHSSFADLQYLSFDGIGLPDPRGVQDLYAHSYRCRFRPCVHTFQAKVENGTLKEEIFSRESRLNRRVTTVRGLSAYSVVDLACLDDKARQNLRDMGYILGAAQRWLSYNVTVDPSVPKASLTRYQFINEYPGLESLPCTAVSIAKCLYIRLNATECILRPVFPQNKVCECYRPDVCISWTGTLKGSSNPRIWSTVIIAPASTLVAVSKMPVTNLAGTGMALSIYLADFNLHANAHQGTCHHPHYHSSSLQKIESMI
jgi:hypothetical protein